MFDGIVEEIEIASYAHASVYVVKQPSVPIGNVDNTWPRTVNLYADIIEGFADDLPEGRHATLVLKVF